MTGDPRDVDHPNWVVRVRAGGGGISYTSGRMTRPLAEDTAEKFALTVEVAAATRREFVIFPNTGGGTARVRTERVTTIDVVPLQRHMSLGSDFENRPVQPDVESR